MHQVEIQDVPPEWIVQGSPLSNVGMFYLTFVCHCFKSFSMEPLKEWNLSAKLKCVTISFNKWFGLWHELFLTEWHKGHTWRGTRTRRLPFPWIRPWWRCERWGRTRWRGGPAAPVATRSAATTTGRGPQSPSSRSERCGPPWSGPARHTIAVDQFREPKIHGRFLYYSKMLWENCFYMHGSHRKNIEPIKTWVTNNKILHQNKYDC